MLTANISRIITSMLTTMSPTRIFSFGVEMPLIWLVLECDARNVSDMFYLTVAIFDAWRT
jgi:hypothetical protein